jgi:hypothetical protein
LLPTVTDVVNPLTLSKKTTRRRNMKDLPPAKVIGRVDPDSDTQKRIDIWRQQKQAGFIDTLVGVFEDIPPEEERIYRADIWARTPEGKPAVPEAHQPYDYTTRVWRAEDKSA